MIGDFIKMVFTLIMLAWGVTAWGGCSAKYWTGLDEADNSIEMSKSIFGAKLKITTHQNTFHVLQVDKFTWNRSTGMFELENLHSDYKGDASGVITADAARMPAVTAAMHEQVLYQEQVGKNVAMGIAAGGEAGAKIIGAATVPLQGASLNVDGPLGKGNVKLGGGTPSTQPSN